MYALGDVLLSAGKVVSWSGGGGGGERMSCRAGLQATGSARGLEETQIELG